MPVRIFAIRVLFLTNYNVTINNGSKLCPKFHIKFCVSFVCFFYSFFFTSDLVSLLTVDMMRPVSLGKKHPFMSNGIFLI